MKMTVLTFWLTLALYVIPSTSISFAVETESETPVDASNTTETAPADSSNETDSTAADAAADERSGDSPQSMPTAAEIEAAQKSMTEGLNQMSNATEIQNAPLDSTPNTQQNVDSDISPDLSSREPGTAAAFAWGLFAGIFLISAVIFIGILAIQWVLFTKCNRPGWHGIVPIYNMWALCEICGKPGWWGLLSFIPRLGMLALLVVWPILSLELAKRFGKGTGFAIGIILLPPIFLAILAFGDAQYSPDGEQFMPPSLPPTPPF